MLSSPLVTPSSALRVSELSVPSTIAMTRYLSSSEPSSITGRLPGHRFVRWRARVAFRSPKVLCDEVVDAQSRRTDAAVLVEALEIDRVLAFDDLARLAEQEAVHLARVRCPRVEHHAIAVQAVREGQSTAAFHPGLGFFLRGHGPAHESLDLVLAVDREAVMFPIDLADQDARPIAEAQLGEGWLRHQVVHRQAQGDVGVLRPEHLQFRGRSDRSGADLAVDGGHCGFLRERTARRVAASLLRLLPSAA